MELKEIYSSNLYPKRGSQTINTSVSYIISSADETMKENKEGRSGQIVTGMGKGDFYFKW